MSDTSPAVLGALKHRNFTLYLVARFVATLAIQMQSVAVGWQVYAITNDPLDLGLIGLAQFLPFIVLVLPAGQIADRYDRKAHSRDVLRGGCASALCCCSASRCMD